MNHNVTQIIKIEAVSDDLSCKTIIERLESVGIFASFLTINPIDNLGVGGQSAFRRDPGRMTKEDLERAGTRAAL